MRILVTGGGGFLGSAVCAQLVAQGHTVRSFQQSYHPALEMAAVEQCIGDLCDLHAVESAVRGRDAVIHCGAKTSVWGPWPEYYQTNVGGTAHVISACRRLGVQVLVYTSSPSVVHGGTNLEGVDESVPYATHFLAPYPRSKALAEKLVRAANSPGLATVVLRPHLIWGPGDPHFLPRLVDRARAGKLRLIGAANHKIDTVYVDNAAEAHVAAVERLTPQSALAGSVYFITQDDPQPINALINALLGAAGIPPETRHIPVWVARAIARAAEFCATGSVIAEPPLTRFLIQQLTTAHWFNITAARRDLGYIPRVSTEEGLRRLRESLMGGQR